MGARGGLGGTSPQFPVANEIDRLQPEGWRVGQRESSNVVDRHGDPLPPPNSSPTALGQILAEWEVNRENKRRAERSK